MNALQEGHLHTATPRGMSENYASSQENLSGSSSSAVNARGEVSIKRDGASTPSVQEEIKLNIEATATPLEPNQGVAVQSQHEQDAEVGRQIRLQRGMYEGKKLDFSSSTSKPEVDLTKW